MEVSAQQGSVRLYTTYLEFALIYVRGISVVSGLPREKEMSVCANFPERSIRKALPVISFSCDAQFLDLALDRGEGLRSSVEKVKLSLRELVEVLKRLGLIEK